MAKKTLLENHLEKITVGSLMEFRADAFIAMASTNNHLLGVNAVGQFVVKTRIGTKTFAYNNPVDAIEKYTELLTNTGL